jgi:hypothetical protein
VHSVVTAPHQAFRAASTTSAFCNGGRVIVVLNADVEQHIVNRGVYAGEPRRQRNRIGRQPNSRRRRLPAALSDNALASNKAVARQVAAAECHNRCGAYQDEHERLPVLG